MRRKLAIRIALVVTILAAVGGSLWAAGTKETATGAPSQQRALSEDLGGLTLPLSAKPITLSIFQQVIPGDVVTKDLPVFVEMTKRTNIALDFVTAPEDTKDEKRHALMAAGSIPDLMWVTSVEAQQNPGMFLKLNDLIDKYAPNIKKRLSDPVYKYIISDENGGIYYLPWTEYQAPQLGFIYRQDYLSQLGVQEPTTLDGWYAVFQKYRDSNLDGSGKKDGIAVTNRRGLVNMFQQLVGSFGLNLEQSTGLFWRIEGDKLIFAPSTDRFKAMVQWTAKLYGEGLLDKEYFTLTSDQWEERISSGMAMSSFDWFTRTDSFNQAVQPKVPSFHMVASRIPKGPFGDAKAFIFPAADAQGMGISAKTKNPVEAIKWLDYQFSRQGKILSWMGVEGISFDYNSDGKPIFKKDFIGFDNDNKVGNWLLLLRDAFPEAHIQRLQGNPDTWAGIQKNQDIAEVRFPPLKFTAKESDELQSLIPDIKTTFDQYTNKLIVGDLPASGWDSFAADLKKFNVARLEAIYNDAYTRYRALNP
jgi:putative aldouronate transport system substrate-binding protein